MSSPDLTLDAPLATPKNAWEARFGVTLAMLLGGVFLLAGIAKSLDPEAFVKEIAAYKLLPWPGLQTAAALALLTLECALGAALIVGYRLRLALLVGTGLFAVFLGALGWAWATGATADCGCFGQWMKRSPKAAFLDDAGLLVTSVVALVLLRARAWSDGTGMWRASATAFFGCLGFCLPLVFGLLGDPAQRNAAKAEAGFQTVKVTGITTDFSRGDHLVALISTDCSHCQESVPTFNGYAAVKDLPGFVALCANEDWKRKFFTQRYGAKFPLGEISQADFDRLIGTGDTPRIFLLRNGKVVKYWEVTPPTPDDIRKAGVK